MSKSEEMLRLERDLKNQPELKEKLEAEIKRVTEAGEGQSDGDIVVRAAAALGYTITPEELERAAADLEKLDDDELEAAGGAMETDEHGHDVMCWRVWHCCIAFLHTECEYERVLCWKDHECAFVNKNSIPEVVRKG